MVFLERIFWVQVLISKSLYTREQEPLYVVSQLH